MRWEQAVQDDSGECVGHGGPVVLSRRPVAGAEPVGYRVLGQGECGARDGEVQMCAGTRGMRPAAMRLLTVGSMLSQNGLMNCWWR